MLAVNPGGLPGGKHVCGPVMRQATPLLPIAASRICQSQAKPSQHQQTQHSPQQPTDQQPTDSHQPTQPTKSMAFSQPLFRSIDSAFGSTINRSFADRAVMAVFAFLVPLLTIEINYFRLAAFRNWFERGQIRRRCQVSSGVGVDGRHHGGDGDSPSKEALALSYGAIRRASLWSPRRHCMSF